MPLSARMSMPAPAIIPSHRGITCKIIGTYGVATSRTSGIAFRQGALTKMLLPWMAMKVSNPKNNSAGKKIVNMQRLYRTWARVTLNAAF